MGKKSRLLIGAHMSIAGGLEKSIERGDSIGCTAIQLFTKSNRQWHAKKITEAEAELFKQTLKEATHVREVVAHTSYLINVGATNREVEKKSVHSLSQELERCELLGIAYLVLHPGSYAGGEEEMCLEQIATNLDLVLEKVPGKVQILIETMAGQGKTVGYSFEQIAAIRKMIKNKRRVGVCLDTCHIFAAGYDFRTPTTYKAMWRDFDKIIGLKRLKAIHMNDSEKGLDSHVDRHIDIGKGKLGLEPFRLIMNDPAFYDIPKILETPHKDLDDDLRNLKTLEKLLDEKTRKELGEL